jgi:two-component system response regulator (stage 0 sporulation protein F)
MTTDNDVKATVLVVDDQPGIRRLLQEVLSDDGYHVIVADNGYDGIQCVKEYHPAVILMDMKMPGMDGIQTLTELKELGEHDKVIMMTAYGELEMVNEAKTLGAYAYITKPFDIIELCQIINEKVSVDKQLNMNSVVK